MSTMYHLHRLPVPIKESSIQIILLSLLSLTCATATGIGINPDPVLQLFPQGINAKTEQNLPPSLEESHVEPQNNDPAPLIRPPYFHSPSYLTSLAQTEETVYGLVKAYEKELLERLQILQRYRADYEDSTIKALTQAGMLNYQDKWAKASIVSSNPMLAYRMIRRFTLDLPQLTDHIWKSLENELWETLESSKGDVEWPSANDILSAVKTLIRLQNIYDFSLDIFTDGVIRDYSLTVGLTAHQSLEVSQTALALGDITAATEWFQVAHSKAIHGNYDNSFHNSIPMDELTETWEKTYSAFRNVWPMTVFKTHDVFAEAKMLLRKDFNRLKFNRSFEHRLVNFKALCRGDQLKTDEEIAELICFKDSSYHPFLTINPLKAEIHNWDPLIYQVHDFLGSDTIHEMTANAVSSISSSIESGAALEQALENDMSTFTYSWIFEESTPVLRSLTKKLSTLMGLNDMKHHLSNYQISAYAVGNHYDPCVDCFKFQFGPENDSEKQQINTKTTVHAILHEPDLGGELAFTLTGTLVKPLKGSLIIYNNINQATGEMDENILHGSCPVLIGQKWIATKLISSVETSTK